MSNDILDTKVPLTGTPLLDDESLGINFYDPQQLGDDTSEYNPSHMDTGTLILLLRDDSAYDGLEIADLRSTSKLGSKNVGEEAVFLPVPANPDEVIVLAGTRLQRLFGKDKVRPCVHRVRGPALERRCKEGVRLSFTIACAVSPVQVNDN
jgi:isopenicillin N synthase-like dioxygenase